MKVSILYVYFYRVTILDDKTLDNINSILNYYLLHLIGK